MDTLQKAVTVGFENNEVSKTRAIIVLYKNQIIIERYAEEYDDTSIFLGWSMTKSVLSTLFGILAYEGSIDLEHKAPIEAWANDDRSKITMNYLLYA